MSGELQQRFEEAAKVYMGRREGLERRDDGGRQARVEHFLCNLPLLPQLSSGP